MPVTLGLRIDINVENCEAVFHEAASFIAPCHIVEWYHAWLKRNPACAEQDAKESAATSHNSGLTQCLCKGTAGLTSGSIIIRRDCPLHGQKNMQL
jgi:hypothetical protein